MANSFKQLFILAVLFQSCSAPQYLEETATKYLATNSNSLLSMKFEEKFHTLGHNFEPWMTTNYEGVGTTWANSSTFLKKDTLINNRGRKYTSLTEYGGDVLLYLDYGDDDLLPLTEDIFFEKTINTARYSPMPVLQYFLENKTNVSSIKIDNTATCSMNMGPYKVEIHIDTKSQHITKITFLSYDELYGDVTTSFNYTSYKSVGKVTYPSQIEIEKINGKVVDTVEILEATIVPYNFNLLEKPDDYKLTKEPETAEPKIKVYAYNNYVHFIDLEHTDDKVMVVEFDEYMFVAEAPLNSKNGELIIAEVKKIEPQKPIKYFAFGHHHPHYLGGLRAFVHKNVTILCTDVSKDYVDYIANAPHTLRPDSLQIEPKDLVKQVILDSLVLGNGKNVMKIYSIGNKSAHTKDYLLYYFPNDKLMFQDDLCWISIEGEIKKARARQLGLYKSIKELKIDVDTIIQSWPVTGHRVKTRIPFSDLEKSANM